MTKRMSEEEKELEVTTVLTWIALATAIASILYAPMLFGDWTSTMLMKLGLFRKIPIAAVVALIYVCGVASVQKKSIGRVSPLIASTIVLAGIGVFLDLLCLFIAFSHGYGP